MRLALQRSRPGLGRTFPRPSVGAVVFRGGRLLGGGATRATGDGEHAEVVALRAAGRRFGERALRGASIAVTLEPCCHTGRSGPCTQALIAAGIRRAYVGCRDPFPSVNGRGIRSLRRAGIDVTVGVLEDRCREHHRGFLSVHQRGRPFVTLKLATTLDGRIATAGGESRWITSEASRRFVHRLRAGSDGVMVGSATALADDPELSARRGGRVVHRPVRVLVDSRLRVPPTAGLYRSHAGARTWVLCGPRAPRRAKIAATGAELVAVALRAGHVDLRRALRALGERGLTRLLVEGGGTLGAALLRAALVDEIHWFLAPSLLGGDARPALGPLAITRLANAVRLESPTIRRRGSDLHISGRVAASGDASRGKRAG